MDIRINGVLRDATIIPAQRGAFCITEESSYPSFPHAIAIAEAVGDEVGYGELVEAPIFDYNGGYCSVEIEEIHTEVYKDHLERLYNQYMDDSNDKCDKREFLERVALVFKQHGTAFFPNAIEYLLDNGIDLKNL